MTYAKGCGRRRDEGVHDHCVTNDLDTLATALYVRTDDLLKQAPELVTLAVMQALLGFTSESRWMRHAHQHLGHLFRYLPGQSGYNKRLRRAAALITTMIRMLAVDTTVWTDDVWVVDSTPGWAEYGYCASHSRYFWGLRLHLVCTLTGLPVMFALAGAKADERETLLGMLGAARDVTAAHPGQVIIGDKNYFGRAFEAELTERELTLLRPVR